MNLIRTATKILNAIGSAINPATSENQTNGNQITKLNDCDDNPICTNYPLATDGDSVYVKDLDLTRCLIGSFSGDIKSLFDDYFEEITDITTTNPKTFTLVFRRPISCSSIGIATATGNFSNVKIKLQTASGQVEYVKDDSLNNNKYLAFRYSIEPQSFDTIVMEFHTADPVKISGMLVEKDVRTVSRMQALKPDGTVTNIDATVGGNLKVSLEELENAISVNSNSQLKITPYHEDGIEGVLITGIDYKTGKNGIDSSTETLQQISYEHHEIHAGNHFNYADYALAQAIAAEIEFVITTPNTTKWSHATLEFSASEGAAIELYEGASGITGGTSITPRNNNRNSSKTSDMTIVKDPTSITSDGTKASGFLAGGGRVAGIKSREKEFVLKQNETYLIRITSLANNNDISWDAEWYEHTNKN